MFDPDYREGYFEVALPTEDVLGREMLAVLEGVVRIGPRNGPGPLAAINFDGGLVQTRPVTADWYAEHANDGFDDEETLYRYLQEVYDYVFRDGPWPETEG